MVAGQQAIEPDENCDEQLIIFGDESSGNKLAIADRQSPELLSEECSAAGIGETQVDVKFVDAQTKRLQMIVTLQVSVSLQNAATIDQDNILVTKVIKVRPSYILVNNTK